MFPSSLTLIPPSKKRRRKSRLFFSCTFMCRLTNVAIFKKKLKFSPCVPERANLRELGKIQFAHARRTRISPPSKCVFFVRLWQCSYFQDCLCVILPTHRYAYYTTRDTRQARHPPPRLLLFCFLSQCYCSAGGVGDR